MSVSGIQGRLLEVTVVGCTKLKDTEWISRQDPYVCVEYGTSKSRTRTCKDGDTNPSFQEKFVFPLIEGLREMQIVVWNSNTITTDSFIGSGKVQLHKVLSEGYDDGNWQLQTKTGRYGGEVRVIMHYANAKKSDKPYAAPPPAYPAPPVPQFLMYATPPPVYPASYGPPVTAYMVSSTYPAYPPNPAYPPIPSACPPPPPAAYPPPPYPPPSVYPPTPYPPPPQSSSYYHPPPGSYPGTYPPPY